MQLWTSRSTILAWLAISLLLISTPKDIHAQLKPVTFSGESVEYFGENCFLISSDSIQELAAVWNSEIEANVNLSVPNLQVSNKHHYLAFAIKNESLEPSLMLNLAYPSIDLVELWDFSDASEPQLIVKTGQEQAFSSRSNFYRDFVFELDLPPNHVKAYVLHIKSAEQLLVPLKIQASTTTVSETISQDILFGMYSGVILVMFLYNLFVYFSTGDRSYLYYVCYILSIGMTQAVLQGYAFRFIWPDLPRLAVLDTYLFGALSGISVLIFARDFLKIRSFSVKMDNFLIALIGIDLFAIVLSLLGYYSAAYNIINVIAGLGALSLLVIAIYIGFYMRNREAKFFLTAWSVFLLSVIIYVLKDISLIPFNDFTDSALMIGSGIESVLLSLALADRINILKLESANAQKRELVAVKRNEKLVLEQNILLEQKVNERTNELRNANTQLQKALSDLQNAQAQLVNSEKMASLGQLTAGIAHEINNPINFVTASIPPLRRDFDDLKDLISFYHQKTSALLDDSELKSISDYKEQMDFDFLLQEITELINSVEEGAKRTTEIVLGLKTFSRLDESDANEAHVHDLLDSTLIVLRNLTKGRVEINKEYDSSIDAIQCFPGKLNQVFSNVIANAIQALENTENPVILIKTIKGNTEIEVSISDNGPGIPDQIKDKIFDPFFTTKEVGSGTGLGLSIVYSIINQHNGTIEVESSEDSGTTFSIHLPI